MSVINHTECVRTFEILRSEDYGHFYGAQVGERFTTNTIDADGDMWLDPKENPCIREEFWKDLPRLCIICDDEIELGFVKEIV